MPTAVFNLTKSIVIKSLGGEAFVEMTCIEQTSTLLLARIAAMPFTLRAPIVLLTHVFMVTGANDDAWRHSPIKLCRELIKFYEKLTLFIYFSL